MTLAALAGCEKAEPLYTSTLLTEESRETEAGSAAECSDAGAGASEPTVQTEPPAYVYVCGAVSSPGVYEISGDMRVRDAIEAAGWFSEEADQEWLNQAEKIGDGQKIYVYTREETQQMKDSGIRPEENTSAEGRTAGAAEGEAGKVNLNTATREELMTLPGIGEAKADAILDYRTEVGFFSAIEEIQNISGIKSGVFSKIQDHITV